MSERDYSYEHVRKVASQLAILDDYNYESKRILQEVYDYQKHLESLHEFTEEYSSEIQTRCKDFVQAIHTEIQLIREQQEDS